LENTIESFKGNISDNQTKISDIEKTIQLIESKIDELKKGV
jgi:peptidoglycan hydrolase CwlO-like protein